MPMAMTIAASPLRTRLEELLREPVGQHAQALDAIRLEFPHSVQLERAAFPLELFNCIAHALRLIEIEEYRTIERPEELDLRLNVLQQLRTEFIHWLIEKGHLHPDPDGPTPGNYALYFNAKGRFAHVAVLRDGLAAVSKWNVGPLFSHAVHEVPAGYGDDVRFFRALDPADAWHHFLVYATQKMPAETVIR